MRDARTESLKGGILDFKVKQCPKNNPSKYDSNTNTLTAYLQPQKEPRKNV